MAAFEHRGKSVFGTREGNIMIVHEDDLFSQSCATGNTRARSAVKLATPNPFSCSTRS